MQLNHLNLCVPDVAAARSFFSAHFGFQCVHEEPGTLAVLADGHGFALTFSNFSGRRPSYPPETHLGFHLPGAREVEATYDRLVTEGVVLGGRPRRQHGSYVFYFRALDTLLVEVGSHAP